MEIVEDTLSVELGRFLARPLFCFLATVTPDGRPRVSPLWYLWEESAVWIVAGRERSYTRRVRESPATVLAVVDFDPRAGRVQHVGMRGEASVEPFDADRVDRLLRRYLGDDPAAWDETFRGLDASDWGLIRVDPATVVARDQSFAPSLDAGADAG